MNGDGICVVDCLLGLIRYCGCDHMESVMGERLGIVFVGLIGV